MCLDGAPLNSEGTGPDTSRADFVWCMTAITWGRSVDQTAERLLEESAKAKTNGTGYAASPPATPRLPLSAAGATREAGGRRNTGATELYCQQ